MYEEQQVVNTTASNGYFNVQVGSNVGSAKRTVNDSGHSMPKVFQNTSAFAARSAVGETCPSSTYTPQASDARYFRLTVTPSSTGVADTLLPDTVMDSVPNALVAQTVQGLDRSGILQVNSANNLTQTNLEGLLTGTGFVDLTALIAGTNEKYVRANTANGTGVMPSLATDPTSGLAPGQIWYDSAGGVIKFRNGSGTQTLSGGTITGGNVGIGTASPNWQLEVAAAGSAVISSKSTGTSGVGHFIGFQDNGGAYPTAGQALATFQGRSSNAGNAVYPGMSLVTSEAWTGAAQGSSLFFTTFANGTTTTSERMRIDHAGNIGIGTTNPTSLLQISSGAAPAFSTLDTRNNDTFAPGESIGSVDFKSSDSSSTGLVGATRASIAAFADNAGGSYHGLQFWTRVNTTLSEKMRIDSSGNVGIGTTSPRAALDVTGAILGRADKSTGATTISYASTNLMSTTNSCGAFILHHLKDGGIYNFIVRGTTLGTCSFTAFSDAGVPGLTVKLPPNHGATTSAKMTLYTFMVAGTDVFVTWIPGY